MPPRPLRHDDVESTVETRCPAGHPQVLRCYPLRASPGRFDPFPTLFWLVCPQLVTAVSRLEHDGWILRLQRRLEQEPELRAAVARDHEAYAAERWALLTPSDRAQAEARGLAADLRERGIGGIRNRASLKCLHLHVAHHLARGSAIGRALDELGVLRACR